MEQFRLKSIDELDLEFVSKTRASKPAESGAEAKSLIPEINKADSVQRSEATVGSAPRYFNPPARPTSAEPAFEPKAEQPVQKKARPLVPIGQSSPSYVPVGADDNEQEEDLDFSKINYGEAHIDIPEKAKKSGGVLAGKIISIVMLAATVVVFMLGCFVAIFLDNNGSDIGGICFNTMSCDVEALGVSKGDLIISKKLSASEYAAQDLIAVPASESGCSINVINYANIISDSDSELSTTDIANQSAYPVTIMASDCYGLIQSYIPALGGILSFALQNAILVCLLFVLLAALWCLLLVFLEKKTPKAASSPKKAKKNKK